MGDPTKYLGVALPGPDRNDVLMLVAGVDSSTQSCKVVIRDAETGRPRPHRIRRAPGRDGGRPGRLARGARHRRGGGRRARRRRRGRGRRAAARHGLPRRGRRRRPACAAVERPSFGSGGGRSGGRARPAGLGRRRRHGAGRVVHRDQAPLARRARAAERVPYGCGLPAPRLPQLVPRRIAWPAGDPHRPRRRQRHRLLVAQHRGLPLRPARAGAGQAGHRADRARAGRGRRLHQGWRRARAWYGRQRRCRARPRGRPRRRGRVHRHLRRRLGGERGPGRRRDRRRRRLCRRHRAIPAAGLHDQRRAHPVLGRPDARRRPRRAVPAGAAGPGRRRRTGARALPRGRAHPGQAFGHRLPARHDARRR